MGMSVNLKICLTKSMNAFIISHLNHLNQVALKVKLEVKSCGRIGQDQMNRILSRSNLQSKSIQTKQCNWSREILKSIFKGPFINRVTHIVLSNIIFCVLFILFLYSGTYYKAFSFSNLLCNT